MAHEDTDVRTMESLDDYARIFRSTLGDLIGSRSDYEAWRFCAERLCRVSRDIAFAAYREGVTDYVRVVSDVQEWMTKAVDEMNAHKKQSDGALTEYATHVAQRTAVLADLVAREQSVS